MAELKQCPFCGCTAQPFINQAKEYHGVTCMNCSAKIFGFATKELATKAWNKRIGEVL